MQHAPDIARIRRGLADNDEGQVHFREAGRQHHSTAGQVPLVKVPTLLARAATDMLREYLDKVRALMPGVQAVTTPGIASEAAAAQTAAVCEGFLSGAG